MLVRALDRAGAVDDGGNAVLCQLAGQVGYAGVDGDGVVTGQVKFSGQATRLLQVASGAEQVNRRNGAPCLADPPTKKAVAAGYLE